ncbi:MAG: adenosine-specific kinase [Candidatus Omnitrophica bacterium]|nr:adenosine-specific kinase [Candidatus Omnitrophota bacterium]MBU1924296.1 adenosine-specific kinase [Candidatus Omnitrophota bacterium]
MQTDTVEVKIPEGANIIVGQTHFIKTVEDIYEALVNCVPNIKFGVGFCEASGKCLVRSEGNDVVLKKAAEDTAFEIGAGHTFIIFIRDAFPINVMRALKDVPEVCHIFCATANPLQVIVAETSQGRGVLGVIDGAKPKGIEAAEDIKWRKDLLRQFKYKL